MGGLIAIAAVFRTAAGLDRQQARFLHRIGAMHPAVQALRGEDQIIERRIMEGGDLITGPVVTGFGQTVEIEGKVTEVEGPRVLFEVEIRDEVDTVGRVKHTRFVVEKARQGGRLEKKKARLAEAGVVRTF